jgi:hypothetical protein
MAQAKKGNDFISSLERFKRGKCDHIQPRRKFLEQHFKPKQDEKEKI